MEKNNFIWIFFVATFIVGAFIGIAYNNITMTGKAASQNQNVILPVSCTDSDGGWNLGLKGTCNDGNATNYTDSCYTQNINGSNKTFLKEYFCMSGRCSSSPYSCEVLGKKCVNGACTGNATNYSASVTGAGGAGGTCSGNAFVQETRPISEVPPGEPVKTAGEWTIETYGNLGEESTYTTGAVKINDPDLTLGEICNDLVFNSVKIAAEYTKATGKPCWPACYGSNKELLCNDQCSPSSVTVIRKLGCMLYQPPHGPLVCIPWNQHNQCDTCSGWELVSS